MTKPSRSRLPGPGPRRRHAGVGLVLGAVLSVLTALAPTPARAQAPAPVHSHRNGPMTPLQEERLSPPLELPCGLVITEWRGGASDAAAQRHVATLCRLARSHFGRYIRRAGYHRTHHRPFHYRAALLPTGVEYRALNDTTWRFRGRTDPTLIWGTVVQDLGYMFLVGDTTEESFDVTFLHELFHAMSFFYGVVDQHGGTLEERKDAEERLARGFTRDLGHGE